MENSNQGSKYRTDQNGEIVLTEEEFQQLVDVFKTLLEWDNELKASKGKQEKPLSKED